MGKSGNWGFREALNWAVKMAVITGSVVAFANVSPCVCAYYRPNFFEEVTVEGQEKELRRLQNYMDTQATPAERYKLQRQAEQREFELKAAREREYRMRERSHQRHRGSNGFNLW